MPTLQERKESAMQKLLNIHCARRGQLTTQHFTRQNKDGRTVKQGPYYLWQRYVKGHKQSVRIPPEHIAQVQADLAHGREVQAIFDDLFAIMEQTATQQDLAVKKKKRPCRTRNCAKLRRSSS
jgi:hypothetical protein